LQCGTDYAYAVDQFNNVSPIGTNAITISPVVTAVVQNVSNKSGQTVKVQSSAANGNVYIVLTGVAQTTAANLDAAVTAANGAKASVTAAGTDILISTAGLNPGTYYAYAVDGSGDMSAKGANAITIADAIPPIVKANAQSVSNAALQVANVQSNKPGTVYIILDGIPQAAVADLDAAVTAGQGAKGTVVTINTDVQIPAHGLALGTYYAYAVDASGNISAKGANTIIISGITGTDNGLPGSSVNVFTFNNTIVIELNNNSSDKATASIYNLLGGKLATYTLIYGTNVYSSEFKGMIIVKINVGKETIVKKLFMQ
jgi:hypothetical protein